MGILDEAIREHLELKRQHGAADSELKQLEDEAFGPPERPGAEAAQDPFAEAPTEFLATPGADEKESEEVAEAPPQIEGEPRSRRESPGIADLQEPLLSPQPTPEPPSEEEQRAIEHEIVSEPPQPVVGPTTEEQRAIAQQPTEIFDIEEEIAAADSAAPSDEELVEEEMGEPRLAPVDPLSGLEEAEAEKEVEVSAAFEEEEEDFFDEQRLSEELDQALEGPAAEAPKAEPTEEEEGEEAEGEEVVEVLAAEDEDEGEPRELLARDNEDDVLEDTPDFLEDSEDDELWFEQKPPKDFDFDD
jgi:hypothetical protein